MGNIVYFDNAATTRMDDRVVEAMIPYFSGKYANPSGRYSLGYEARKAVNEARKKAALLIGAEPDEIFFTSGGTESNNAVLRGFSGEGSEGRRIISTEVEHSSVLETLTALSKTGTKIRLLKSDAYGTIEEKELKDLLEKEYRDASSESLISVMLVNNETGTINKIKNLADIAHSYGMIVHSDAVQAAGHMKIDVKELGIDSLSVSGHKLYGPKGTGFVYLKRGIRISPILFGGGQEKGLRPGTENVAGIVGLGEACEIAASETEKNRETEKKIGDFLKERLLKDVKGARLNGTGEWILNFSFDGINGTSLALRLDMEGVCVSTGSACNSGLDKRSHVLLAMGMTPEQADSSVRLSIGKYNSMEDAVYTVDRIEKLIDELRTYSMSSSL